MTLRAEDVKKAITAWPCRYETPAGRRFVGAPVSEVPKLLREAGWRNVSHIGAYELAPLGLEIVEARYVGGVRPKRFCRVVVAAD